jgi:hypothetical protein
MQSFSIAPDTLVYHKPPISFLHPDSLAIKLGAER